MRNKRRKRSTIAVGAFAAFLVCIIVVTPVGLANQQNGGASLAAAGRLPTIAPLLGTPAQLLGAARNAHASPAPSARRTSQLTGAAGLAAIASSRIRFKALSAGAAIATAKATFGPQMFAPAFNAMAPMPGVQRVRGLGMMSELVRDAATGRQTELQSPFPLEVPGPSGTGTRPVDLAITPVAGGFAPRAPIVPVTIADTLQGGVTFPQRGFGFHLAMGRAGPAVGNPSSVFLPNVSGATDTDFDVVPMPNGVESYLHLRSPAAPEQFPLAFSLPPGAHLQIAQSAHPIPNDPPTAIEIAASDGHALGYIYQPTALDANGTSVAAHATISGNDVVLTVSHHVPGIQYPVLVDPLVIQPSAQGTGTGGGPGDNGNPSWLGWAFSAFATYRANGYGFGEAIDDPAYFPGLYESMPTNNFFNNLDGAIFYYPAPAGTYLSQVAWSGAHTDPVGMSEAVIGIQSQIYPYNFTNGVTIPSGSPPSYIPGNPFDFTFTFPLQGLPLCYANCDPTQGAESSAAVLGITALGTSPIYTYANKATVTANAATVALGDRRPPIITSPPPANIAWVNDQGQVHRTTAAFHDDGLGLFTLGLRGATNGPQTFQPDPQCGDVYRRHCPNDYPTYSFNYLLPEGVSTLQVYAQDVAGNSTDQPPLGGTQPTTQTFTAKVDRTPPDLALSGPLSGLDGQTLTLGSYGLTINGSDGLSGVAAINVLVDTVAQGQSPPQTNPADGAPLTRAFTLDTTSLANGSHTVEIDVVDRAGNVQSDTLNVVVQHVAPLSPQSLVNQLSQTIGGALGGDKAGTSITNLGDLNGDGVDDFAVGAPTAGNNLLRLLSGSVYIVSGAQLASGAVDLSNPADYLLRIDGPALGAECGSAVSAVGDINGSGDTGLAIGCPGVGATLGLSVTPQVYAVFGDALLNAIGSGTGHTLDLASLGSQGFVINGPPLTLSLNILGLLGPQPKVFGEVLAGESPATFPGNSGDLNNDGRPDIVIGDPSESNNGLNNSGSTYVVFGKADSNPVNVPSLGSGGVRIDGAAANDYSGTSVALAGSLDGADDPGLLIGAPLASPTVNGVARTTAGAAYALFGSALQESPKPATISLANVAAAGQGYVMDGASAGQQVGASVAGLGDVNTDGQDDIALSSASGAYVLYGQSASTAVDLGNLQTPQGYAITAPAGLGATTGGISNTTVAAAGDMNGDGVDDVTIGFPAPSSGPPADYVVFSSEAPSAIDLATIGAQQGALFTPPAGSGAGTAFSGQDAVDATGTPDGNATPAILIGAPTATGTSGTQSGSVYQLRATQLTGYPSAGAASTACTRAQPYYHPAKAATPYTFCYLPAGTGLTNIPGSRATSVTSRVHTAIDAGSIHGDLYVGDTLKPTEPDGATANQPLFDSSQHTLGYVVQCVAPASTSTLCAPLETTPGVPSTIQSGTLAYRADDKTVIDYMPKATQDASFTVQGQACSVMNPKSYSIVAFTVRSAGSTGINGRFIGIRAFMSTGAFTSPLPNPVKVMGCGHRTAGLRYVPQGAVPQPTFPNQFYQGYKSATKACPTNLKSPTCGDPYSSYENTAYGQTITLATTATTGVNSGGVARVILATGTPFAKGNSIPYPDPNVPCSAHAVVQWLYGRFAISPTRNAYGWVPTPASSPVTRAGPFC